VLRLLGEAIRSVNDAWGVFSPSRIELYPHQLWVCKKVTERWPVRWVVADDVGLGKTIEAGLILWRLFSLGLVKRLLILCPASLVRQWQARLLDMFDIRVAEYVANQDSGRVDFWRLNNQVVASFQTLRDDRGGRHDRMLAADSWDLVIMDEAHHLNFDEATGMTLGHRLMRKLQDARQVLSLLLFTGTPHRGKHFGFLALMSLARPDLFDPRKPAKPQLARLPEALIRNNKYCVTDLRGQRLFREPQVNTTAYHYSAAEQAFYLMMTEFIASGQAYATRLDGGMGRAVMLVLVSLQKLASSSVAAVRSALQKRLAKMRQLQQTVKVNSTLAYGSIDRLMQEARDSDDEDEVSFRVEDQISTLALELMENECDRLAELIRAADGVTEETKIHAILEAVATLPSGESVLFFTEYKATQGLLLASLWRVFGPDCAAIINGDEGLESVALPDGSCRSVRESRLAAADRFNAGEARFLISTEAGGEGIDLQERCSRLIHVDLPWNPMRLHQRVGRLNRIGQHEVVKVMLFQNPDTVESRIWTLLNQKLERITQSINMVTEQPEDLRQLVLGVTRQGVLDTIFAQANFVERDKLDSWFDRETGQMGGEDALRAVHDLLGHAQQFDYAQVSASVPKMDLPDLIPFFRMALRYNRRQVTEEHGRLAFKTPEAWQATPGVRPRYDSVHFDRKAAPRRAGTVLGVGNRLFDAALGQACQLPDTFASVDLQSSADLLLVFRCYDRVTGNAAQPKAVICGVLVSSGGYQAIRDWQVMQILNELEQTARLPSGSESGQEGRLVGHGKVLGRAEVVMRGAFVLLDIPYRQPDLELLGVISGVSQTSNPVKSEE
jgi:ERCC4-related helicase